MYYYELHVFYSRSYGYSVALESVVPLDEEQAIAEAKKQSIFAEDGDHKYIDYVKEISKDEYESITKH